MDGETAAPPPLRSRGDAVLKVHNKKFKEHDERDQYLISSIAKTVQ